MKQYQLDQVPFFQFESFADNGRLRHAIFTRLGGTSLVPYDTLNLSISVPDDRANVFANRARAYGTHGRTNGTLVHAHLTHGAAVARVTQGLNGQYVGPVDGLITNQSGCGLTMNYADCTPVMIYDPENQAIALGHAGWKGVVADLPGALVRAMSQHFGSRPELVKAGIGPCIGPCCYEVSEPVLSEVRQHFSDAESLLLLPGPHDQKAIAGNRRYFDLPEANRRRLEEAGVEQIEIANLCTACHTELFFSHRAEGGRTGRFGAIMLLGDS